MIFNFINYHNSSFVRRLLAAISLLLVPVLVVLSILIGTAYHVWDFVKQYALDLYSMFTVDLPRTVADLWNSVRTGKLA